MAVNHVDGELFASIFLYPIVAGMAAVDAGAKWTVVFFVVAAVPIGAAVIYLGRTIIYWLMGKVLGQEPEQRSILFQWVEWVVGPPMFALYIISPLAVTGAGLYGTWWLVKQILA